MFIFHFADQSDHRHSEPEKKCLAQCFPSHVFYLRKKNLLDLQKKPKVKQKKLRIAIKQKWEWKRKKIVKTTSHTTYSHTRSKLHYIHTLIHQTSSLSIIHVIKSINQQNPQFSISTLLSSLYPNIRLQCLSISRSRCVSMSIWF